jgi:hypothetical protein
MTTIDGTTVVHRVAVGSYSSESVMGMLKAWFMNVTLKWEMIKFSENRRK